MITKWVTRWCVKVRVIRERIVTVRQQIIKKCTYWASHTSKECVKWADESSNQCVKWGVKNVRQCRRFFKWFCKAFVIVATAFCVAFLWVVKIVCVAFFLVVKVVCVVFAWILQIVVRVVTRIWLWVMREPCEKASQGDLKGTVVSYVRTVLLIVSLFGGALVAHSLNQGSGGSTALPGAAQGAVAGEVHAAPEPSIIPDTADPAEDPVDPPAEAVEPAGSAEEPVEDTRVPTPVLAPAVPAPPASARPNTERAPAVEEPESTAEPEGGTTPPSTTPVTVPPAPLAQTVDFGPLIDRRYAGAGTATAFAVTASASSGLAVTFSTTTPAVCVASGSTVVLRSYGVCTVVASQEGNDSYLAASPVAQSFNVTD